MEKFLGLLVMTLILIFIACDTGTNNNRNDNSPIIGIWEDTSGSDKTVYAFNKDNTGERFIIPKPEYYDYETFAEHFDIIWDIYANNLCITVIEDDFEECYVFSIVDGFLFFAGNKYKRIDKLPEF